MNYDEADEVIKGLFESLFNRYQIGLETSVRGSGFIFSCVNLLPHKYHKINLKLGGSNINYPDQMKKQLATINPSKDKCFEYVATFSNDIKN